MKTNTACAIILATVAGGYAGWVLGVTGAYARSSVVLTSGPWIMFLALIVFYLAWWVGGLDNDHHTS